MPNGGNKEAFKMKKLLSKLSIVMVISCLFTSCTVTRTYAVSKEKDYKEAFVGVKHNDIVSAFGAPDRQTSDGAGGTILIYERTTTNTTTDSQAAAYNVNYYNRTYTPGVHSNTTTTQNTSYIHIFVDKDGVCYNVKTNHQKYITEVDEKATARNKKIWKVGGTIILAEVVIGTVAILAAFLGAF